VAPISVEQQQGTLDEVTPDLLHTTFVVVDLETTGGSAQRHRITEIGAVKVRGGERLGEFQTLVNPGCAIPPLISVLTGISDAMVADAPSIRSALPSFLEFARGGVLVAHNAPFDIGFLKAACRELDLAWPDVGVVDTAALARRVVHRDEAPNCKLATLSRLFGATTTPDHRALHDARATVDVLHGLLARLGERGAHDVAALREWQRSVPPAQRSKRHLARGVPAAPGVYSFVDRSGERLYVGTSTNMRTRVQSYFTAAEKRRRMVEMVGLAERVDTIRCATPLEAAVRELRLIAAEQPRYNRRSKHPDKAHWLKLTDEPFPRVSLVTSLRDDGCTYLGPFSSRAQVQAAAAALHQAVSLRQCSQRISPGRISPPCALLDLGRCPGPCQGLISREEYEDVTDAARTVVSVDPEMAYQAARERIDRLSGEQRYEEAQQTRDNLASLLRVSARHQRVTALAGVAEIIAARRPAARQEPPRSVGRWEIHVVRHGRLAASGTARQSSDVLGLVEDLAASAEQVSPGTAGHPSATWEEADLLCGWLDSARLIRVAGEWTHPTRGAGRLWHVWQARGQALKALHGLDPSGGKPSRRPEPLPRPTAAERGSGAPR
jgi:DNA polymerase-3 subunit epsilon